MKMRRRHLAAAATTVFLALAATASGEVKTKVIDYTQDGTPLQGQLAWDDAATGKRPAVLVVHEWWGHNEHARHQARRLAEAGYVAFALDMFGKGKVTTHPKEAGAFMQEAMKDPAVVVARFNAALEQLKKDPHVDPTRIAAVGYCMGGTIALEMARAGADLDAVVALHAGLGTKTPAQKGKVKARILVLNGAADPMVPQTQVEAFKQEMTAAGAKFEVVTYPNVKHAYTNPDAGKAGLDALAYDAHADKESWAAMTKFLKEVLGGRTTAGSAGAGRRPSSACGRRSGGRCPSWIPVSDLPVRRTIHVCEAFVRLGVDPAGPGRACPCRGTTARPGCHLHSSLQPIRLVRQVRLVGGRDAGSSGSAGSGSTGSAVSTATSASARRRGARAPEA
jgi:dienelactone hydrolase